MLAYHKRNYDPTYFLLSRCVTYSITALSQHDREQSIFQIFSFTRNPRVVELLLFAEITEKAKKRHLE